MSKQRGQQRRVMPRRVMPRGDRGVSLVEYALLVAAICLLGVAAVDELDRSTGSSMSRAAVALGASERVTGASAEAGSPAAGGGAAPVPTATSTVPSTSRVPSTSPVPSTSTVPSTTTTAPPARLTTALVPSSVWLSPAAWRATVRVTLSGSGNAATAGVSVAARFWRWGDISADRSCVTNGSGWCELSWDGPQSSTYWVDVTITGVTGGAPWTGSAATVQVLPPR